MDLAGPSENQEHPLVAPQDAHLRQEPLRTMVNCPQVPQGSPSYPFIRASCTSSVWDRDAVASAKLMPETVSSEESERMLMPPESFACIA